MTAPRAGAAGRLRSVAAILAHGGMVLVLAGALVTALTAERGFLPLGEGEMADGFIAETRGRPAGPVRPLGFAVRLVDSRIVPYPSDGGPLRVKEYESEVEIVEGGRAVLRRTIRVNAPLAHRGIRLSQFACDSRHGRWSVLGVSRDRGAGLVFLGFAFLAAGVAGCFHVSPALARIAGRFGGARPTEPPPRALG